MANTTGPRGASYRGWFWNAVNGRMQFYENGVLAITVDGNDVTIADALTVDDITSITGAVLPQAVTIGGIAYTFPADNGDAGEQLQTDGAGALTWEASGV